VPVKGAEGLVVQLRGDYGKIVVLSTRGHQGGRFKNSKYCARWNEGDFVYTRAYCNDKRIATKIVEGVDGQRGVKSHLKAQICRDE
jgi:hypothetical protein